MGTTKTASARALLDPKVKEEAEEILHRLGQRISSFHEFRSRSAQPTHQNRPAQL